MTWNKLFNKPNFSYIVNSKKVLNYKNKYHLRNSIKLLSIIYPGLELPKIKKILDLFSVKFINSKNKSLLDFGSGNGALLYYLENVFGFKNNLSFEISKPLLNFQKKILKKTNFYSLKGTDIKKIKKLKDNIVDYSVCMSTFQYFPNKKYSLAIIKNMIRVTRKKLFFFDIKDIKSKKKYILKTMKKNKLSKLEFKKRYHKKPFFFFLKLFLKKYLVSKN